MLSPSRVNQTSSPAKFIQAGIITLAMITAFIHFMIAFPHLSFFSILFYLNTLGYIVLLVLYSLPQFATFHTPVRWLFIGYALLTIILYFLLNHHASLVGYANKLVEVALIILLLFAGQRHHKDTGHKNT